jgi:phosphate starvation-inducible PhoH-like protein
MFYSLIIMSSLLTTAFSYHLPRNVIPYVRSFSKLASKIDKNMKSSIQKKYQAKSDGQVKYKQALYDKNIHLIVCDGPAGSGKTSLACDFSLDMLKNKNAQKIIITRPTISIEEDLGYLPGNINKKMYPWTIPIFDVFLEYFSKSELDVYIRENIIEICPLGFIQGRTFKNSIIIADEMQNSTPGQMFMLLTRIGENSKMILNGDLKQTCQEGNGLHDLIRKINKKYNLHQNDISSSVSENLHPILNNDGISLVHLQEDDIQRHEMVKKIIDIYQKK